MPVVAFARTQHLSTLSASIVLEVLHFLADLGRARNLACMHTMVVWNIADVVEVFACKEKLSYVAETPDTRNDR
jgi:hypothetical protein